MPSLKDLRNRIASTKATQKITQGHADGGGVEAAPRAGRRRGGAALCGASMDKVLGNIAASSRASPSAPRLLRGTGSDDMHLLLVCTAERGLCGPFNTAIVRLARERADALIAEGKEVKFFCVGRKGYDQLRAALRRADRRAWSICARCASCDFDNAEEIAEKIIATLRQGRVRRLHAVLSRFSSVIAQIPTAQQIIPAGIRRQTRRPNALRRRGLRLSSPMKKTFSHELLPRNIAVQIFRALLENTASFYGAQMSRDGQCHAQCRRHDPQADASL